MTRIGRNVIIAGTMNRILIPVLLGTALLAGCHAGAGALPASSPPQGTPAALQGHAVHNNVISDNNARTGHRLRSAKLTLSPAARQPGSQAPKAPLEVSPSIPGSKRTPRPVVTHPVVVVTHPAPAPSVSMAPPRLVTTPGPYVSQSPLPAPTALDIFPMGTLGLVSGCSLELPIPMHNMPDPVYSFNIGNVTCGNLLGPFTATVTVTASAGLYGVGTSPGLTPSIPVGTAYTFTPAADTTYYIRIAGVSDPFTITVSPGN